MQGHSSFFCENILNTDNMQMFKFVYIEGFRYFYRLLLSTDWSLEPTHRFILCSFHQRAIH